MAEIAEMAESKYHTEPIYNDDDEIIEGNYITKSISKRTIIGNHAHYADTDLKFIFELSTNEESGENTRQLYIYTINKVDYKYETTIENFTEIQKPKVTLLAESVPAAIIENMNELSYEYYTNKDIICIYIPISKKCTAEIQLTRADGEEQPESILAKQIDRINNRLCELGQFTEIHSFKYPKWASIEEFKKLDCYKYIGLAIEPDKYLTKILMMSDYNGRQVYMYLLKCKEKLYGITGYQNGGIIRKKGKNCYNRPSWNSLVKFINNPTKDTPKDIEHMDSKYCLVDCCEIFDDDGSHGTRQTVDEQKMYEEISKKWASMYRPPNQSKIETYIEWYMLYNPVNPLNYEMDINYYVKNFISAYIKGWCLANFELVADRQIKPRITVNSETNEVTTTISVSEHKIRGNCAYFEREKCYIYPLPEVLQPDVIIDGIRLDN